MIAPSPREISHPIITSREISKSINYGELTPGALNTVHIVSNELGQLFAKEPQQAIQQEQNKFGRAHREKWDNHTLDEIHNVFLERLKDGYTSKHYKSVNIVKRIIDLAGGINKTIEQQKRFGTIQYHATI